ncbi:hypothetical protein Q1695_014586 [Nippostrongylus brasiliensis]|nr:hypothetical protein Q1695_014586 [Nippostrongylus brasiliensis]
MDLYVKCTLEHYDTTSVKHFSGALHVDPSENSFRIVGPKEQYKFFANEFNRLIKPPCKSTAQIFSLDFNLTKQPSARHHIRKRRLIFKMADLTHKVKEVYDELKKIFPRTTSPVEEVSRPSTSPVGILRSHPSHGTKPPSRAELISRSFGVKVENPRIRGMPPPSKAGASSSAGSEKRVGSLNNPIVIDLDDCSKSQKAPSVASQKITKRQEEPSKESSAPQAPTGRSDRVDLSEKPSGSADIIVMDTSEPTKTVKPDTINHCTPSPVERVTAAKNLSRKSSSDLGSQGSAIVFMEASVSEKCSINVSEQPSQPHTPSIVLDASRNSHKASTSPSMYNDVDDDDLFSDGFSSTSFYGSSRSTPRYSPSNRSAPRPARATRVGEIASPRPHLLAESISSSRCLVSPISRKRNTQEDSLNRDFMTPVRKRKENEMPAEETTNEGPVASLPSSNTESSPYSYRGFRLENLSNSCYMNATLQALATVYPFYYRMQVIQQCSEKGYGCSEFVRRFNAVLQHLVSPDRVLDNKYGSAIKSSVLEALKEAAGRELGSDPDFGSSGQQDAHEFLSKALDAVEKEALRLKKRKCLSVPASAEKDQSLQYSGSSSPSSTNPTGVFQHKIRDRLCCKRCAHASEVTNNSLDVTVTISAVGESIQRMVEHAFASEEIEYKCDKCGPGSGFVSRAFETLPQALIVVVKRYRFGEAGGSKMDERIDVSRELYLKDLYIETMKKPNSFGMPSVSQSLPTWSGEPNRNGHFESSYIRPQRSESLEVDIWSGHSDAVTSESISLTATDQNESDDCLLEASQCSDRVEKYVCTPSMCSADPMAGDCTMTQPVDHYEQHGPPHRTALSPLKMNRRTMSRMEKLEDTISPVRKLSIGDAPMDIDGDAASHSGFHYREKENVGLAIPNDSSIGIDVVKQSGGYLKDPSDDDMSAATKRRSSTDGRDSAFARQVTEPLRPSSRSFPSRQEESRSFTPANEHIKVLGEFEEKTALVFRPITEACQKKWCAMLGFKYTGTPEMRKRTFGREIEFSLRDMPLTCDVRGDGNCLFRTLCWWITGGSENQHFKLREKLVAFMTQHCTRFSSLLHSQQDMESHLQRMSEDGEWGTQVELAAAACWLGVNIYTYLEGKWLKYRPLFVWSNDGKPPISLTRTDSTDANGAIFICNASGCHFQPAISVEYQIPRRNLRPRRDRDVKETPSETRTPEPPYLFNPLDGPVYSLAAVICHHGDSLFSGHYSTYALDNSKKEWLNCNDDAITKISEVEVIDNSSSIGYIFIYSRVEDPNKRL